MPEKKPITFGQFVNQLVKLKRKYGVLTSTPIAYAQDDEGNSFQYVVNLPGLMFTKGPAKYGAYINDADTEPVGERFICLN